MNTSRMIEISKLLGGYIKDRATCNITISHLTADMEGRKTAITPEGGWPGKNAEERKHAETVACANDDPMQTMRVELVSQQDRLVVVEAEIAVLETERRALEWSVRGALVDALAGRREAGSAVDEGGFDDAAQAAVDETVFVTDDLPF